MTRSGGSIANAPSFLVSVGGLEGVCPGEMEDLIVNVSLDRAAKHARVIVLVHLEVFGLVPFFPFVPFVEFEESATGEFHCFGGII